MKQTTLVNNSNVVQTLKEGYFHPVSAGENFTFRPPTQIDEQINLPKSQTYLLDEFTLGKTLENEIHAWKTQVAETLEDIRCEAKEAYASDNEIDRVPESAYHDATSLLEMLFDHNVPMPHIGWAEDGSIGLEWRPENGIVTMGIYGDNLIIYGAFFQEHRQVEGVCHLSDTALLESFLETLKRLL
jgi:hypothetical protein